jgi:hypothetical protein
MATSATDNDGNTTNEARSGVFLGQQVLVAKRFLQKATAGINIATAIAYYMQDTPDRNFTHTCCADCCKPVAHNRTIDSSWGYI